MSEISIKSCSRPFTQNPLGRLIGLHTPPQSPLNNPNVIFMFRGSYQDYFAKKMATLKSQGKFADVPTWTDQSQEASKSKPGLGASDMEAASAEHCEEPAEQEVDKKKTKKSKVKEFVKRRRKRRS